jgi:hypothetical protein
VIIYLDESGDLGFDFKDKHPSVYFVITILISNDYHIFKSSVRRTLKNKVNHKNKKRIVNELKGADTTFEIKKYFYQLIGSNENWFLHTIIIDKQHLIKTGQLIAKKEKLYNILSSTVLEEIDVLNNFDLVHLYIDMSKTTREIKVFDDYIKSNLEKIMPAKSKLNIEHLDSEKNAGLQAVDMFCYGIARKYEYGDDNWYNLFKDRIKKEIIYRP